MKYGIRTPSIKKRVSARTTGRMKRAVKRSINPLYGKKGMGYINNPKKAVYNKIYNKTTVSVDDVVRAATRPSKRSTAYNSNSAGQIKKQSILVHILLLFCTFGIGNIIYALSVTVHNNNVRAKMNSSYNRQAQVNNIEQGDNELNHENNIEEVESNNPYEINKQGMELEEEGDIEGAKEKYLKAISLGFEGCNAYDRLNVIFRKEKDYDSEIENCRQAIEVFSFNKSRVERYTQRLNRAMELKNKRIDKV